MPESITGPIEQYFDPNAPALRDAGTRVLPLLQQFKQEGVGFGAGRHDVRDPHAFSRLTSVSPKEQNEFADAEKAKVTKVYGKPASERVQTWLTNEAKPGLMNKMKYIPQNVALAFGRWTGGPMLTQGRKEQLASFIGFGEGTKKPGEKDTPLRVNAGDKQMVEAMQGAHVNEMEGVRKLTQIVLASLAVGGGIGLYDAWVKRKKARELEKELTQGLDKQSSWLTRNVTAPLSDTFGGLPKGEVASALPYGLMIPLTVGAISAGVRAGYKPVDAITDAARERWLREKKLKARKEFHDALTGMSKAGAALDVMAEDIVSGMEKEAVSGQALASAAQGIPITLLGLLAGGSAIAGSAIADARDKGRKRYAELEREIRSRALPSRLSVTMAAEPEDVRRRLSTGEVVIPEVVSDRKKRDPGGSLKLALFGEVLAGQAGAAAASPGLRDSLKDGLKSKAMEFFNIPGKEEQQRMVEAAIMKNKQQIGEEVYNYAKGDLKGGIGNIAKQVLEWLQNLPQHLKSMKMDWLKNLFGGLDKNRQLPLPAAASNPSHGVWSSSAPPPANVMTPGSTPSYGGVPDGAPVAKGATTPAVPRVPGPATRGAAGAKPPAPIPPIQPPAPTPPPIKPPTPPAQAAGPVTVPKPSFIGAVNAGLDFGKSFLP